MTSFVHRYDDRPRPRFVDALKGVLLRTLLPGVLVWAAVLGFGFALTKGPLSGLNPADESVSRWFAERRTGSLDTISKAASTFGDTPAAIAACAVIMLVVFALTREWWFAILPGIAMQLQSMIFVVATWIVDRPRPKVSHLDPAPPTSSYPSGHVGASFALWWTVLLMVQRIRIGWLRWTLSVITFVPPFLVMWSRLYRGMHHLSDVLVGMLVGIASVALAWAYLPPSREVGHSSREVGKSPREVSKSDPGVPGPRERVHAERGQTHGDEQQ